MIIYELLVNHYFHRTPDPVETAWPKKIQEVVGIPYEDPKPDANPVELQNLLGSLLRFSFGSRDALEAAWERLLVRFSHEIRDGKIELKRLQKREGVKLLPHQSLYFDWNEQP